MTSKRQFDGERVKLAFTDCANIRVEHPSRFEGTTCYASTSAINGRGVDEAQLEYVTYENRPSRANLVARDGDVLFARMKSTCKTLLVDGESSGLIYSTGFVVAQPRPGVATSRCLFHLVGSGLFNTKKDRLCTGATQKAITNANLKKLMVSLPSYDLQDSLMDQLDYLVEQMDLAAVQIRKLDTLVKSRFVEMFGEQIEMSNNDSWPRLGDLSDVASGITKGRKPKTGALVEVPYMAVSNVKAGYIDLTRVKTIKATTEEIDRYSLEPGDVLMTEGGDPDKLGRGAVIRSVPHDCIHQNHVFRVRLDEDILLPEYLEMFLLQDVAKLYFLSCAKRTTGIATINRKQIRSLPVYVPALKEQRQFIDFVAKVDKPRFAGISEVSPCSCSSLPYRGHSRVCWLQNRRWSPPLLKSPL